VAEVEPVYPEVDPALEAAADPPAFVFDRVKALVAGLVSLLSKVPYSVDRDDDLDPRPVFIPCTRKRKPLRVLKIDIEFKVHPQIQS